MIQASHSAKQFRKKFVCIPEFWPAFRAFLQLAI